MNYAAEHNIYPVAPLILHEGVDTIMVKQRLTFEQISEFLNIPLDVITYLNPCYKMGVIPSYGADKYPLRLPKKYMGSFMVNEDSIYNFKTKTEIEKERLLALKIQEQARKDSLKKQSMTYASSKYANSDTSKSKNSAHSTAKTRMVYTVKPGDGLGKIASRYNCSISNMMAWNNLKNQNIHPNQKLYVEAPLKEETAVTGKTENNDIASKEEKPIPAYNKNILQNNVKYHVVQKGDTLWSIASKYKGVTVDEIKKLNNLNSGSMLYVGQKLKIKVAS